MINNTFNFTPKEVDCDVVVQEIFKNAESMYFNYFILLMLSIGINIIVYNLFRFNYLKKDNYTKIRYYVDVLQACLFFGIIGYIIWVRL